ncbi:MAG TPA: protein kinase [Vicinamibacterales bacterium]|nr:protein kinase [Vicinamibacterales bacterium]
MVGTTIAHYRIIEKLGAGGMGEVFKAEDLTLGRLVALKFLPPSLAGDRHAIERLRREARAASVLNHPGICTIHAIEERDGQQFIAMEFVDGQPLSSLIAAGAVPLATLLPLALQIADALEAAHSQGIVHRDIKPGNIFVTKRQQAKILDFGLVKASSDFSDRLTLGTEALTTTPGMTVGTIAYMSPEQARGEPLDARTDLFSFGLVLYEMATGRRAFGGTTTAVVFDGILNRMPPPALQVNPDLPPELDRIIGKAVEKERELRYQTAVDLAADLQRLRRDSSSTRVPVAQSSSTATPVYAPASSTGIAAAQMASGMSPAAAASQPVSSATVPAATTSRLTKGLMIAATFVIVVLVAMVAYMSGRMQQLGVPVPSQADAPAAAPAPAPPAAAPETPAAAGAAAPSSATPGSTPPASTAIAPAPGRPPAPPPAAAAAADGRAKVAKEEAAAAAEIEDVRGQLAAGQYGQAIVALNSFIERNPAHRLTPDAYMLLGQAYESSKRDDEAVRAYASLVERFTTSPRAAEALFRQAQRVMASRQPQREQAARQMYAQVADQYPKSDWAPRALVARAEIEERMRERVMDQAVGAYVPFVFPTYRALAERYPVFSENALWKMSEILEDLNRYPLQAQALDDLTTRFPETKHDAAWKLGEIRERRLKDRAGAVEAYSRVPSSSPKYRDAQRKVQELSRQ